MSTSCDILGHWKAPHLTLPIQNNASACSAWPWTPGKFVKYAAWTVEAHEAHDLIRAG